MGHEQRQVGFLTGCVMRSVFAATNAATVRVLTKNGCRVVIPRQVGCCGALHAHQATSQPRASWRNRIFGHLKATT